MRCRAPAMGNQSSTPARVVRTLDPAQVEKMGGAAGSTN
jgi:hypothetical protein